MRKHSYCFMKINDAFKRGKKKKKNCSIKKVLDNRRHKKRGVDFEENTIAYSVSGGLTSS